MKKDGYYITEEAYLQFKEWLLREHLTVNKFAKKCGVSRQYIERALYGKIKITEVVKDHFKNGGYELL